MNISVNGESRIPPGFRFHPTEEELLNYYLKKKVCNDKIDLDVIFELDLNKLEPWDIQEKCRIGTTPQNDWYFFSHKDKKYPTGTRTNRATVAGFWKATGRDKAIYGNGRRIGMRKTLVFYQGRAPHGQKSDWIMHEYRLDESSKIHNDTHVTSPEVMNGELAQEEGWVVCKIFKKKNNIIKSPRTSMSTTNMTLKLRSSIPDSPSDNDHDNNNNDQGALGQIFQPVGNTNNKSFENRNVNRSTLNQLDKFMKLPSLESPHHSTTQQTSFFDRPMHHENKVVSADDDSDIGLSGWATLDRFLATQIHGHNMENNMTSIFTSINVDLQDHADVVELPHLGSSSSISSGIKTHQHYATNDFDSFGCNEVDLWSFTRSTVQIDPFCHLLEADL